MTRRRTIWAALVALILSVVGGALGYRFFLRPNEDQVKIAGEGIAAEGVLVPQVRRFVYYENGVQGQIIRFDVNPGDLVPENQTLLHLHDVQLEKELSELNSQKLAAEFKAKAYHSQAASAPADQRTQLTAEAANQTDLAKNYQKRIDNIRQMMDEMQNPKEEFTFHVKAPQFTQEEAAKVRGHREWTILDSDFKEQLTNRTVRPSDPILRIGAKNGPWELEMKIPQKQLNQVLLAYQRLQTDTLDVEFTLKSDPTRKFQGKLPRDKIAGQAKPSSASAALVVIAYVRLDGDDIEPSKRVPPELLVSGTEINADLH